MRQNNRKIRRSLMAGTAFGILSIAGVPAIAQEDQSTGIIIPEVCIGLEGQDLAVCLEENTSAEGEQQPATGGEPAAESDPMPEETPEAVGMQAELIAAHQRYVAALAGEGDAVAAYEELRALCAELGIDEVAVCLDEYVPAAMRVPGDSTPPDMPQEAAPAEEESVPAEELTPEQAPVEEPAPVEQPAPAEEPAPVDEAIPAEEQPTAEEPAPAEELQPAETETEVTEEQPVEADVSAELRAGLVAAYQRYVNARAAGTGEAEPARQELLALCAELGIEELEACLDQYIPDELRMPGDTDEDFTPAPLEQEEIFDSEAGAESPAETPVEPVEPSEEAEPAEVAPLLDSQKEQLAPAPEEEAEQPAQQAEPQPAPGQDAPEVEQPAEPTPPEEQAPPPESDQAAQAQAVPLEIAPITEEQGTPVETRADAQMQAPAAARMVEDFGPRIVFEFNNQLVVVNREEDRLYRDAEEHYYEELPDGRTRETIIRPDGSRVVTIRNRFGDVIRRSRFDPQGREYVLVYVDRPHYDELREWEDPGLRLPPLRLNIPVREYVLDADQAGEDELEDFLDQPPVEQVRRLYSIDEVKRSARIRDTVRRLEIGGLTFETGRASIAPDQVNALAKVASAMLDLLERNPAETFLIEGHTDAVGGDAFNLALSDRRAETVAVVLSEVFGVPPENLVTQGYGERYLKILTEGPERRNRRVTVRRITPLVAPVAQR